MGHWRVFHDDFLIDDERCYFLDRNGEDNYILKTKKDGETLYYIPKNRVKYIERIEDK